MKQAFSSVSLAAVLILIGGGTLQAATPASPPLSPDAALQELEAGNQRFVSGGANACSNTSATRSDLTSGQAPNAIVLSCSDSRVPPEQVFDQGLGKIFVIRVAGNILNTDAVASIEYAVANLGTRLIVILGHESCGAVGAAIDTKKGSAESPSLDHLLSEIRANLGNKPFPPDPTLRAPVMQNVSAVATDLTQRSKIVRDAVASGQVQIVEAIYGLASGVVDFWNAKGPVK